MHNKILFLILVSVLFLFIDKSFVIEKIYFQTFDKEYYFGKSSFRHITLYYFAIYSYQYG